jgi:peptide-methionine (S)-S-oxide reductase
VTYELIGTGRTGHAEVVQISYDPNIISYEKLLEIFFTIHDPTTQDRQGNDVGSQYRSIILTHDESQELAAKAAIQALKSTKKYPNPIVTEIKHLAQFYPAEAYHQDYFKNNPNKAYCQLVVKPKVDKVKNQFEPLLKSF